MKTIKALVRRAMYLVMSPSTAFLSADYQRINQRRLEHLASLGLDIDGRTILEVAAGIGDHTSFFIDRGCRVVSTEARKENLKILRSRYPGIEVRHLDVEKADPGFRETFDVVYCYGCLYHLQHPGAAIEVMARHCGKLLLMETCVSYADAELLNPCDENPGDPTQSVSGHGCRPTRKWVYNQLKKYFEFVYLPKTQPWHEQFPLDWTTAPPENKLTRAIFVASREKLNNGCLTEGIPLKQERQRS